MSTAATIYTPKDVYFCDGVTFEFPVTFAVDKDRDIAVFLTVEATGATRRMVRNQDYVVRDEDDGTRTVVTRVDDYRPPWPAGYTLTLIRRMSFAQPSGRTVFNARVFGARIDTLTRIYQQLREQVDRTLKVGQNYPAFYKTSRPYSIILSDAFNMGASAATHGNMMWSMLPDSYGLTAIPTGGTLAALLQEYTDWPAEEFNIAAIAQDGVLDTVLLQYTDAIPEGFNVTAIARDGLLDTVLVSYSLWPAEGYNITAIPTGGTLA